MAGKWWTTFIPVYGPIKLLSDINKSKNAAQEYAATQQANNLAIQQSTVDSLNAQASDFAASGTLKLILGIAATMVVVIGGIFVFKKYFGKKKTT